MLEKSDKIALGTVQFGLSYGVANSAGQVSIEEVKQTLAKAKDYKIGTLDTAAAYGNSEEVLGKAGVNDWDIITKIPRVPDGVEDIVNWVIESVKQSLFKLSVNKLYGVLLHDPKQLLDSQGGQIYQALLALKSEGFVSKIGASIYQVEELEALSHKFKFDLVQAPFNIIDRRLISSGWMKKLYDEGVELHVRSVFLQGLLLMGKEDRPKYFDEWDDLWVSWQSWLEGKGVTAQYACLNYALSFPEISKVVIGVDNSSQLEELLCQDVKIGADIPRWLYSDDINLLNPAKWDLS